MRRYLLTLLVLWLLPGVVWPAPGARIKDVAKVRGMSSKKLVGYGLVVGLDRTGDTRRSELTIQSVVNMMQRFGIRVSRQQMRLRNVAAVMVTAELPPFARTGQKVDVQVSSLGDAQSLEGGTLLMSPLVGPDGQLWARAQGPLATGGFNVRSIGGDRVRKNYTLVARVPGGATVERDYQVSVTQGDQIFIALDEPDFTTAVRLAQAINRSLGSEVATATDAVQVAVTVPADYRQRIPEFISMIEGLETDTDEPARVVVNERTGTVVVGGNVTLKPVAVSHGNLSVEIQTTPVISQPPPFSQGETVVVPQTQTRVTDEGGQLVVLEESATVADVAKALNALGVGSRDIIAIFQALKQAGALKAELIIL
jgi:flagellar P-ring protein precursor FlgI